MRPASFLDLLDDRRVIVVVRHADAAVAEAIGRAAARGGLRAVEVTTTVPGAPELIAALRASLQSDVLVGAGTVLSVRQLEDVLGAGAQFAVAPGLDQTVVEAAALAGAPILPGAMTATEVMAARALGLDAVKLFPAGSGGPGHLRALRSVFADVAFVPTGGVDSANAGEWLAAGARAIGLAGEFGAAYHAGGEDEVHRLARRLAQTCEAGGTSRPPDETSQGGNSDAQHHVRVDRGGDRDRDPARRVR